LEKPKTMKYYYIPNRGTAATTGSKIAKEK